MEKKDSIYVCMCYMTVEGQEGRVENRRKYEILKRFVRQHRNERVLVVSDINEHIGLLGERINAKESMLREVCGEESLEILNETVAEGNVTGCRRKQQSVVDYVLANELARKKVMSVFIDEEKEFSVNTDHNVLLVRYECKTVERKRMNQRHAKWKLKFGN